MTYQNNFQIEPVLGLLALFDKLVTSVPLHLYQKDLDQKDNHREFFQL